MEGLLVSNSPFLGDFLDPPLLRTPPPPAPLTASSSWTLTSFMKTSSLTSSVNDSTLMYLHGRKWTL